MAQRAISALTAGVAPQGPTSTNRPATATAPQITKAHPRTVSEFAMKGVRSVTGVGQATAFGDSSTTI
jgi:hypothetical protein